MSNNYTHDTLILIVDDKERVRDSLSLSLEKRGFHTITAASLEDGRKVFNKNEVSLALVDIMLGEDNGLDLLKLIQTSENPVPVIMFTGYGTIESAIDAIKMGAFNYLQKPIKIEQLVSSINAALKISFLEEENAQLQKIVKREENILIRGSVIEDLYNRAERLAQTELPVLIQGESGTGKEMVAETIHKYSNRKNATLIKINCAALPETLLDDELFGHEKGAFTGATKLFKGVFERADGGTLFLDELGDMSLSTQAKILRAIQNHEVKRIGGNSTVKVDVRFIAATNKNLEELMVEKVFREDLYYRLSTAVLQLPPLRERRDEIIHLANHFLSSIPNPAFPSMSLAPETIVLLQTYDWPGNIRELKSTIQYSAAIAGSPVIKPSDLPRKHTSSIKASSKGNLKQEMEADLIVRILGECGNNKKMAAEMLGISRATLYNKLKEFGL